MSFEEYTEWVAARFPGARLRRAWPLRGGVSAVTDGVELQLADGRLERLVVRQQSSASFKTAPHIDSVLEHDLLAALHGLGLPVARPRFVDTTCRLLPRPYVVCELVEGSLDGPTPERIADQMADLLARVHGVPTRLLPPGLPGRDSPLAELYSWIDAALFERAARAWRDPPAQTLLHGDFWPGNLLWRDGSVAALLDWEDAALGDPLSDLACARLELRCALGEAAAERFTERYLRQTSTRPDALVVWQVYVATAALASMDEWGLAPEALALRKQETRAFLELAQARLPD